MKTLIRGLVVGLVAGLLLRHGLFPLAWLALLLAGCVAVNLVSSALFPGLVGRLRGPLERHPLRAFLCGVLALLVGVWAVLSLAPPLRGLAIAGLVLGLLAVVLAGMPAAIAGWMGQRLVPEQNARRQLIVGTGVWGATLVVPVVGWLLAAGLAISGLGASVLAAWGARRVTT